MLIYYLSLHWRRTFSHTSSLRMRLLIRIFIKIFVLGWTDSETAEPVHYLSNFIWDEMVSIILTLLCHVLHTAYQGICSYSYPLNCQFNLMDRVCCKKWILLYIRCFVCITQCYSSAFLKLKVGTLNGSQTCFYWVLFGWVKYITMLWYHIIWYEFTFLIKTEKDRTLLENSIRVYTLIELELLPVCTIYFFRWVWLPLSWLHAICW